MGWICPAFDISSARHETAFSRLFISIIIMKIKKIPTSSKNRIGRSSRLRKTMLHETCEKLRTNYSMAVITNDIYTLEDAQFLVKMGALDNNRIVGVETGGCPHTAIRDDTTMNNQAIAQMEEKHSDLEVILVESGGDNLSATFSPELVDTFIYVIDVSEGDKIPRKGGPAIRFSDLMIINKIDLAPYVGADLDIMERDSKMMRGDKPTLFCDLKSYKGIDAVVEWIKGDSLFEC